MAVHGLGLVHGKARRPRVPGPYDWQSVDVEIRWRSSCLVCGAPVTATVLADVCIYTNFIRVLGAPWMLLDMPDGCPECAHPVSGLSTFDWNLDGWEDHLSAADEAWVEKVRVATYGRRWADGGSAR